MKYHHEFWSLEQIRGNPFEELKQMHLMHISNVLWVQKPDLQLTMPQHTQNNGKNG
jgi:hypothetical protein